MWAWDATRRMWCCKWDGREDRNPGREHVCERVPVEVIPCVIKMSAASMAVDCVDRMSSCASDLVVPMMQS